MSNSMSNSHSREPEYITKVSIEHFPSRVELYSFLDTFLQKNDYKKDYTSENKDNLIIFSFKNPDIGLEFVKNLNLEKMKNNLYSKVKTNLYMDVKKGINSNKFRPPKNDINKSVNNTKNLGIDKSYLNIANSSRIPRLANSVDIALDKNLQKKNNRSNINSPDRTNINIEKNRYGYETSILRISTPYISQQERSLKEYQENKKRWVIKNDFSKYVGAATIKKPTYIPNFVSKTPSDPPVNYQFRNINKEKWIAPKNFMV